MDLCNEPDQLGSVTFGTFLVGIDTLDGSRDKRPNPLQYERLPDFDSILDVIRFS